MKKCIMVLLASFPLILDAQTITTFAGNGTGAPLNDGSPATAAAFPEPKGGAFDKEGNYYCAEGSANIVRKVDRSGLITTIAGNGISGFSGDGGTATAGKLHLPNAVNIDTAGNIYISDAGNYRIRKVDRSTGIITTYAGIGIAGYGGDNGPATAAMFNAPNDICFDKIGNMYIADYSNASVRKITVGGIISTIAGNGIPGYSGDYGPATAAQLRAPQALAIDDTDNLYIAGGNVVRKINSAGIITTVAGVDGTYLYTGDGLPATSVGLFPVKIGVDAHGDLIIADYSNVRVLKVDHFGIINTIAGTGNSGFSGDNGPATAADFNYPAGVTFDFCGNLYISDIGNKRIRKVTYPPVLTVPSIALSSPTSSAPPGTSVTINATVSNAGSSYIIHWLNKGVEFTTTTVPSVTYTKASGVDTITARVVSTATYGCYDSTTSNGWVVTASGVGTSPNLSEGEDVLRIWPTPTEHVLHIDDVAVLSSYRVISMVGAVMLQGELKAGSNVIDVRGLPAGMYMVVVSDEEERRVVRKIVRQ